MIPAEQDILIRDMARQFAQERLKPFAADWDREHRFPVEALKEMADLGFLGMLVPEEWGGAQTGHLAYAMALEEIAAGDGACSTIMSVHNSVGCMPILKFGSEEQKQRFLQPLASGAMLGAFALTEPQAGSDASDLRTRARRDGDHYVLNGAKQFITSGSHAGLVIVFAVTDPAAGKKGISAFIVPTDTPGYSVVRVEDKLGQHASDTCQIQLDEVRIPASLRLGEEDEGYRIALSNLEGGRIGIAVARQMVHHAAALREAGQPCLTEASMAKLFASEMAEQVCSAAIQTLGGYGYLKDFPVERIYRDVRVCQIYEGTSDVQRMVIARSL
ncbi:MULTISPECIES: acyl-CoA dehydrogenase family protein [unclassified Pseudomonas]|uniref:acyl-CoA dehydrogenase family protein n=1 Tax=unclassified Pseudomonas TaxID=196821 RepID=UPI00244755A0|nr:MULTISPECIES: acyl-CoA dehydrogenase family protein [unclassified Pseudomonas]MDH0897335.1 acyl-CoA dehydrogenase family protein [Pseudomonas sp. GD03875]MDH1067303.1 acyl-CoA dehydrogenase family protein [Pseudomonas sp. GD03985]